MLYIEEKANITSDDSVPGINAKLNLLDNAGNLMMHYGDMADDYVKEHGKLDPAFDKSLRKEIAGSRLPNVVPKEAATPPSAAPAATVSPERSAIEDEMRRRGLLKGSAAAPVSQ
jgi:hypothetical protein